MKKELMQGMIDSSYKADIPVEKMTDEELSKNSYHYFSHFVTCEKELARRKAREIFYGEKT